MDVRLSAHGAYCHLYHIVWIPKYRRRILKGALKTHVEAQLRSIEEYRPDVQIERLNIQLDHIHLIMVIPPKHAVSDIVRDMKANSSREARLRFPEVRSMYWRNEFWSPGFFSSTVGLNEAVIKRYVEFQEKHDKGVLQMKMF